MIVIIRKSLGILFFILKIANCAAQDNYPIEKANQQICQEWIAKESFDKIFVSNGITLHLLADENQKIQVQTDKNLLKCITMEVSDNVLQISSNCNFDPSNKILVHITLPTIKCIKARKNCMVFGLNTFKGESLQLKSSHESRINIATHVENLELESSHQSILFVKGNTKTYTTRSRKGGSIDVRELDHPMESL